MIRSRETRSRKAGFLGLLVALTCACAERGEPAARSTDLLLVEIVTSGGLVMFHPPQVISARDGYDNQAAFDAAGARVLFSSATGGQIDVWAFDLLTRDAERLLLTAESEYSPLPAPAGQGFLAVRVERDGRQRVWRFGPRGEHPRVALERPDYVGYQAWPDEHTAALVVLGEPSRLVVADLRDGTTREVARGVGRAVQSVPGRRAVSYVDREDPAAAWVAEVDLETFTRRRLVRPLGGGEDHAWSPDGTLWMASGPRVFGWTERVGEWTEIADFSAAGVVRITRLAASADGRWMALVVDEPD